MTNSFARVTRRRKHQSPTTKLQRNPNLQTQRSKKSRRPLNIEVWNSLGFGVWNLAVKSVRDAARFLRVKCPNCEPAHCNPRRIFWPPRVRQSQRRELQRAASLSAHFPRNNLAATGLDESSKFQTPNPKEFQTSIFNGRRDFLLL